MVKNKIRFGEPPNQVAAAGTLAAASKLRANSSLLPSVSSVVVSPNRPVVILSDDTFNERSGTVIAMAITSQEPKVGFPLALELTTPRLPKRSWVKISQIRTLSVQRLGSKLARASDEELSQLIEGLNEICGH